MRKHACELRQSRRLKLTRPCGQAWSRTMWRILRYKTFYRHQRRCLSTDDTTYGSVHVSSLNEDNENEDFYQNILAKFRDDDVGRLCTSDTTLKKVGLALWQKQKRKERK